MIKIQEEIQQLDQPDNAIVTVCASRFARSCTNRANYALQVIQMLGRRSLRCARININPYNITL